MERRTRVWALVLVVGTLAAAVPSVQSVRAAEPGRPIDAHAVTAAGTGGTRRATSSAAAEAEDAGVDIGGVMETVRHYVEAAPDGTAFTEDHLYRMRATPDGFDLTLRSSPTPDQSSGAHLNPSVAAHDWIPSSSLDRLSRREAMPSVSAEALRFDHDLRLGISLRQIRVGKDTRSIDATNWDRSHNTVSREHDLGLTERVTARDGHVEWDFVLDAAPSGDVSISADVSGGGPVTRVTKNADNGPKRFPVPAWRFGLDGERAVRVGEMIVVDAEGRELLRALPEVVGTKLRMHVPASLLATASYPVTIDPPVSPEYPASDPVIGAGGGGSDASLAWNGTDFLIAWTRYRPGTGSDIFATRVSADGTVLDPTGIAISTDGDHYSPSIAWNGTDFLVVWYGSGIHGTRVSADGTVLDPAPIPISEGPYRGTIDVAVSSDGTNFLVVWRERALAFGLSNIVGKRVSGSGAVLDPTGIVISAAPSDQSWPSVAWGGTSYLVAWHVYNSEGTDSDIYGARVSADGEVLDPLGIAISGALPSWQSYPSVASDGTNFLVVWEDSRSGRADIYGARVSAAGTVLDAYLPGILISTAAKNQLRPSVAWGGTSYLVVWEDWRSFPGYDIHGARVDTAGKVLDAAGIVISTATNEQSRPSIASDGTDFLVVWEDRRSGPGFADVYGARVSSAGTVLDAAGIALSLAANSQTSPSIAWDGTNFLVVWEDDRAGGADIYGARVSSARTVLDAAGIAISTAANSQFRPSVAWDGANFLVAWTDQRSGTSYSDIYAARVSAVGTVLDPAGIAISTAANYQSFPSVAWDGTSFLVAWTDYRSGTADIYGARVSSAGTVLDRTGIVISGAANEQFRPSVASDGTNILVVWDDQRSGTADIYGARVSAAGIVVDPAGIAISTAANNESSPSVAWDGTNFVVAWEESAGSNDIYAARVSAVGTVLDPTGFGVAASATNETSLKVVDGPPGTVALVYRRIALEPPYGSDRVFVRFYDGGATNPRAETTLEANPVAASLVPGTDVYLTPSATLTAGQDPVAGKLIGFTVGSSAICTAMTNANGRASCTGTDPLVEAVLEYAQRAERCLDDDSIPPCVPSLRYTARFAGDIHFLSSSDEASIIGVNGEAVP